MVSFAALKNIQWLPQSRRTSCFSPHRGRDRWISRLLLEALADAQTVVKVDPWMVDPFLGRLKPATADAQTGSSSQQRPRTRDGLKGAQRTPMGVGAKAVSQLPSSQRP